MAVVIETTLGDLTVDLFIEQRPRTCLNFLKLCKMKYYNFNLFHTVQNGFIAQTGDPTGEGSGGSSIWGVLDGADKRYFSGEKLPKIRHTDPGLLSMVAIDDSIIGSQFFFTLGTNLNSLDSKHCVIGEVVEGHEVLRKLNETICDESNRPYQDVRITHTVVLDDPFNDPKGFRVPSRSPSPSAERLVGGRLAPDEEIDETKGKTAEEIAEMIQEKEARARATILEIVGDLPDADMAPPENVLFVCKLNPVTTDEDLEIIFSRFGKILNCEVIRDKKSGDSLQYAFIEFEDRTSCENAYFKMDNVLIDDRRIHVDFSQSVSKIKWQGKGRGVIHVDDSRHSGKKQNQREGNHGSWETEIQRHHKQSDVNSSSNRHRESTRSQSRDRRVDRSKLEKSRHDYDDQHRSKDRYKNKNEHSHSYRDKDRNNYASYRSRNPEKIDEKERQSNKNARELGQTKEKRRPGEKRQSRSPYNEKEYKDNGHKSTKSTHDYRKATRISNGEESYRDISKRRNRSASRCDTPPPMNINNSVKRKLEDNSLKPEISSQKKIKKEKEIKKKSTTPKRKKKPSSSSESSSTDSSQSSSSSSSDSSSSESDRRKKKISKKKQIKKKKKQQTSSSSSDSSSDSSSSSSDSSSSNSSESDSEPSKKKKRNVKKKLYSKKVRSRKRRS